MFCLLQNSEFAGVLQFPRVQFPIEKKAPINTPIAWSPIPSTRPIYLILAFPSRIAPPPSDPASLAVYPALQQDMLSCCIPKDLQGWNRTEKRRNPEEALQSKSGVKGWDLPQGQGRTFAFVPDILWRNRTVAVWLVAALQLVDDKRKSAASGLDTDLCECFSLREETSCWGPRESLGVAEERGINELCHFAVTWKGIATHHKQHLGDLTVQIRKEWETSKPW